MIEREKVDLLRHHARSVVRELGLLNDAYFDIGVTLAERHLLIELNSCLYPTISDIAERLLLDKSTASRLIAKAVAKGYVAYSADKRDKRKRYLSLTEKGKEILHAFEPIAFNHTKEALLTLNAEEAEIVYQGMALYAKGLKNSRVRSKITITPIVEQDNAAIAFVLKETHQQAFINLFEAYQKEGSSYLIMKMESKVIGGGGIFPYRSDIGTSCQLERICLQKEMRDLGLEKMLIESCIKEANRLGYDQFYVDASREIAFSPEFFQSQCFHFLNKFF